MLPCYRNHNTVHYPLHQSCALPFRTIQIYWKPDSTSLKCNCDILDTCLEQAGDALKHKFYGYRHTVYQNKKSKARCKTMYWERKKKSVIRSAGICLMEIQLVLVFLSSLDPDNDFYLSFPCLGHSVSKHSLLLIHRVLLDKFIHASCGMWEICIHYPVLGGDQI